MKVNNCELCQQTEDLGPYLVGPELKGTTEQELIICKSCAAQIEGDIIDPHSWKFLGEVMWSEKAALQVLSYRMLSRLSEQAWALDFLEQLYLDEELISWAKKGLDHDRDDGALVKDSNGTILKAGDTVTLIKDLDVKGAGFTAKRGTMVKSITLTDNPDHIEGRVNGVKIVLVSKYLKKA